MRAETLIRSTVADSPIVRAVPVGAWRSPVSALVWGTRGREFKSRRPDQKSPITPRLLRRDRSGPFSILGPGVHRGCKSSGVCPRAAGYAGEPINAPAGFLLRPGQAASVWTPNFRGTRRQETRARLRPFGANGRRHTWQGKRTAQRSANVSTSRSSSRNTCGVRQPRMTPRLPARRHNSRCWRRHWPRMSASCGKYAISYDRQGWRRRTTVWRDPTSPATARKLKNGA